jgi:hypothetical protein
LFSEDHPSAFFPSPGTANLFPFALRHHTYNVCSVIPVSRASDDTGTVSGGIMRRITASFCSAQ